MNGKVADKTNSYFTYKKISSIGDDWTIGTTYDIAKNTSLDISYRSYKEDTTDSIKTELKGFGFGVNYKF